MAPSRDRFLHYTTGKDATLSLALVLVNVVLVSAAILLYCSICKRRSSDITNSREKRERSHSELKKVTILTESETQDAKVTNNGVIPSGAEKNRKSKKDKKKDAEPERNGSVVKDDDQVLVNLKNRVLPLPPPPDNEDSEYEELGYESIPLEDEPPNPPTAQPSLLQLHSGPNGKHLGDTSGSIRTMAVGGGDALENINPLYVSVEEGSRNKTPENQESEIDLPSPGPNQGDEPMKEPMHSNPNINEPIYSVVRKDKLSVKNPPTKPMENLSIDLSVKIEVLQEKTNHSSAPVNPEVPPTSSFKLNTMIKNWRTRNLKTSPPQPTVSINVDLEDPPPIPDKAFDIGNEAESEERHPNEDNTETDIKTEE
ncbi:altered inheritance of mitochondria protein 3-like [Rana temporaria]|uniref:altered inheritance of mitochondria protein 3-like n=1 Tax=Rana temporaria TaxID=8407 RepID=UPI001AAD7F2D|nr:altered inheritance of mitochondria protein 3-like [Rana temporaria]